MLKGKRKRLPVAMGAISSNKKEKQVHKSKEAKCQSESKRKRKDKTGVPSGGSVPLPGSNPYDRLHSTLVGVGQCPPPGQ